MVVRKEDLALPAVSSSVYRDPALMTLYVSCSLILGERLPLWCDDICLSLDTVLQKDLCREATEYCRSRCPAQFYLLFRERCRQMQMDRRSYQTVLQTGQYRPGYVGGPRRRVSCTINDNGLGIDNEANRGAFSADRLWSDLVWI